MRASSRPLRAFAVLRRILLSLCLLAALTFQPGTLAHSLNGIEATSAEWSTAAGKAVTAKRSFREDGEAGSLDGWTDDQDEDDRVVRVGSAIRWPIIKTSTLALRGGQSVARTHPACASPPRGPPSEA
jgi:hypothetical protein